KVEQCHLDRGIAQIGEHGQWLVQHVQDRLQRLHQALDLGQDRSDEARNEGPQIEIDVVERDLRSVAGQRVVWIGAVESPVEDEVRGDRGEFVGAEVGHEMQVDVGVGG